MHQICSFIGDVRVLSCIANSLQECGSCQHWPDRWPEYESVCIQYFWRALKALRSVMLIVDVRGLLSMHLRSISSKCGMRHPATWRDPWLIWSTSGSNGAVHSALQIRSLIFSSKPSIKFTSNTSLINNVYSQIPCGSRRTISWHTIIRSILHSNNMKSYIIRYFPEELKCQNSNLNNSSCHSTSDWTRALCEPSIRNKFWLFFWKKLLGKVARWVSLN